MKRRTKELKDIIVGAKFNPALVLLLDEDADREGTSRSHILRRIALQHYKNRQLELEKVAS